MVEINVSTPHCSGPRASAPGSQEPFTRLLPAGPLWRHLQAAAGPASHSRLIEQVHYVLKALGERLWGVTIKVLQDLVLSSGIVQSQRTDRQAGPPSNTHGVSQHGV